MRRREWGLGLDFVGLSGFVRARGSLGRGVGALLPRVSPLYPHMGAMELHEVPLRPCVGALEPCVVSLVPRVGALELGVDSMGAAGGGAGREWRGRGEAWVAMGGRADLVVARGGGCG